MNILISGISGFVGSNLAAILKNKHCIYGLDIVSLQMDQVVKTYRWNHLKNIAPIGCIIHLAGKAHDTRNKSSREEYFDINFGLTKKIFDKFLDSDTECFIFFSSVKAIADVVVGDELVEDVTPAPVGPYGESKLMAEEYIMDYFRKDDERLKNKRVYILRPCMIHGPGNKGNLNLLYNVVKRGIPWPLGSFENKRSFTSIENICFIINNLIQNKIPSGIYNIADDESVSTNRLIELISEVRGRKSRIINVSPGIIKGISRLGDILHLPLNSLRLQKLTESYVVSNKKIKAALGIDRLPISAEEGLIKTLNSFNE
jgi:nucleoside-diphosphate-sugar epimerase